MVARAASELGRGLAAGLLLVGCVGFVPAPTPDRLDTALAVPAGFRVAVFAEHLGPVRFLAIDPGGTLIASVPRQGQVIALPDTDGDGRADGVVPVIEGLELPHGLAFHDGDLYVAETGRVVRVAYDRIAHRATGPVHVVVPDLPARGGHWTRTIAFGPDGRLYVSVGSSCNNCEERDARRAAITRYRADGREAELHATGLRNAVGLAFHPSTGDLWATNNGRDWLGDDRPPEYITRVAAGGFYGWPHCYVDAGGIVLDPDLPDPARCRDVARPSVLYQAHSAPLGLTFYTGRQFPKEYWNGLFVALHGSWNRSVPTGYKVIHVRLDGDALPRIEDFVTGWLTDRGAWGRPVDVVVGPDGSLLISDDALGVVYRITYPGT